MAREETAEIPAISMASTKKEMLDAYREMKQLLLTKADQAQSATKLKEKLKHEAAADVAAQALERNPLDLIRELQAAMTRRLNELAEEFESERARYGKLCEAVANKKQELETIYEVESAAGDLMALIETQRQRKEDFEATMARRKDELASELTETKEELERARVELEYENEERRKEVEKIRKREREDYDYGLKRERQQRKNALEDEMAQLQQEIDQQRQAFAQESAARQAELDQRERVVTEREKSVDELQRQVDAFPGILERKVATTAKETTAHISAEYEHKLALQAQQFEGNKNVLSSRIEGLEQLVESLRRQVESLSQQQEKAYEKVQDIATRAVDRASGVIAMPAAPGAATAPPPYE